MALHLRWLTTEKFQNNETVKGGCITSKNKFKTRINNKLRWLTSDINFKLLHTGCPIAHALRGEWPSGLYSLRQVAEVKLGRVRSDFGWVTSEN